MLRFKMLESRPAFEDYVSRLNTRPASIADSVRKKHAPSTGTPVAAE